MNETVRFLRKISGACFVRTVPRTGKVLFAALFIGILVPSSALAQVVITEIMYDLQSGADGGREWIEVHNGGTTAIPLGTWKLFENGTAHKITAVSVTGVLAPGSYAVIADNAAKFQVDWPQLTGQLFDSAFSLGNSGETLVLRNASSTDIDTASYQSSMGAAGDGNSLNRVSSGTSFIARSPTPGAAMSATALAPPPPKEPVAKSKPKKLASAKAAAMPATSEDPNTTEVAPKDTVGSQATPTQLAAGAASSSSWVWWLGAFAIALFAGAALFLAKRLSKNEWDIEEMGETG